MADARAGGRPGPGASNRSPFGPGGSTARHPGRRTLATFGIGAGAAAAVVSGIVLLMNAGVAQAPPTSLSGGPPPLLTASHDCCRRVPANASGARQALVSLRISTPAGLSEACGLAFGAGGLVVTTADALSGGRPVAAMTARGGWSRATLVATDPAADVAVLRVRANLPVARFADDGSLSAAAPALVMVAAPRQGTPGAAAMWAPIKVRAVGATITSGSARGLAAITTKASPVPPMAGEPLIDQQGDVVGLLDSGATGNGQEVFLPAHLVVGVAGQLARWGRVGHGWLDVALANPSVGPSVGSTIATTAAVSRPETGAEVVSVTPGGAAAGLLSSGDVIVSVNGQPVRSMAELRTRLYVMPAGRWVQLDVWRGSGHRSVGLALAASP